VLAGPAAHAPALSCDYPELMAVVLECSSASVQETLSPVRGGKYLITQPPTQLLIQLSV
jgi:hypothetical protein